MKNLNMIVWLTQLGLSVALPLAGFTILAVWLRQRFDLGIWVLFVGVGVGLVSAVDSFQVSLKAMEQMSRDKSKDHEPPPLSFNDHD